MFSIILLTLISCSSTDTGIKLLNKSPRGITISNIVKEELSKAYQTAEKHCAKYYKVPRVLKTINQEEDELQDPMKTKFFECIKPSS